ncbi:hypothetical protein AB0H73_33790 [Streptomyces olivoreticuli]
MITQRYGDLELGFTTNFSDQTGGAAFSFKFWRPTPPAGWWALGAVASPSGALSPQGRNGGLIVRQAPGTGTGLLAQPVDYQYRQRITDGGTASTWRPVPPAGYVALGDFTHPGLAKPPLNAVACVKKTHGGRDYVRRAEVSRLPFWRLLNTIDGVTTSGWGIEPPLYPSDDTDEHLFVPTGLFTVAAGWERPSPTDVTWVLDLPAIVEKGPGPAVPQLHSHDQPPAQTTVITDRTVTVPYFMVADAHRDEKWKVDHSPFYKVRRNRYYELKLFRNNQQGSEPQTDSEAIETGVSREQSEAFTQTTGMSVSATAGIEVSAKPFGMGATASFSTTVSASLELGYEKRYSVTTFEHTIVTRSLTTPPKSSGALWMERHELIPIRADGTQISNNAKLPFRTLYYHTGQYPPARATGEHVVYTELSENGQPLLHQFGIPVQGPAPEENVIE